jgi:adenylate kinase
MGENSTIHDAILLIGPTGSGKSPLGCAAEKAGLDRRACLHFDFGHQLRQAANGYPPDNGLTDEETQHIRQVLAESALLEDDAFTIAATLLKRFIAQQTTHPSDTIILNGLPRHSGQARRIEAITRVIAVVNLDCPPSLVAERIRQNSGGDRRGRTDDDSRAIAHKLAVYAARTAPLLEHYRGKGAPIITRAVSLHDSPQEIWQTVSAAIAPKAQENNDQTDPSNPSDLQR